jgi:hypothetical protein
LSAHFAIPATTFVLKAIIEARLKVAYGAFAVPKVSIEPPPRPPAPAAGNPQPEPAGLNLFMHHASANGAWRNMYEPHVDGTGKRFTKAPLVLDLHYLLGAQGSDLEREALLGVGMSALHRNGVIPRPMIKQILDAIAIPAAPTKLMDTLTGEPLDEAANQPESITVSPQAFDVDMSTKVWSALQSPMRPCAYYLVTTVFLDTGEQFPPAGVVESIVVTERPAADPAAGGDEDVVVIGAPLS